MRDYKLIAYGEASRIERATGINPDELLETISLRYRLFLSAKHSKELYKELAEITLCKLIEGRRAHLEKEGKPYTESALKSWAKAHQEYRDAIDKWDEAGANVIEHDTAHKKLQKQEKMLYKEADLARQEMYSLTLKQ